MNEIITSVIFLFMKLQENKHLYKYVSDSLLHCCLLNFNDDEEFKC